MYSFILCKSFVDRKIIIWMLSIDMKFDNYMILKKKKVIFKELC